MTRDFTLKKYARLCETIRQLHCPVMTVRDFVRARQPQRFLVVLRHDVDRQMGAALRMARLEFDYSIAATYYARTTRAVFRPDALRELHRLGHEVGYHYEVLAKAEGDTKRAVVLFERDLKHFREIVPVDTVSMHGSPLSRWNNLDVWQTHDLEDYDVMGDAVLSIDGRRLHYVTDTGRSWNAAKYNLRDHMVSRELPRQLETTDDLIDFLRERPSRPVYISAHPNRWASNWLTWSVGAVCDWVINQAKWLVSLARSQRR